jgi:hypothetical protein
MVTQRYHSEIDANDARQSLAHGDADKKKTGRGRGPVGEGQGESWWTGEARDVAPASAKHDLPQRHPGIILADRTLSTAIDVPRRGRYPAERARGSLGAKQTTRYRINLGPPSKWDAASAGPSG